MDIKYIKNISYNNITRIVFGRKVRPSGRNVSGRNVHGRNVRSPSAESLIACPKNVFVSSSETLIHLRRQATVCVCVCVCVRERERERERVCVCRSLRFRACVPSCKPYFRVNKQSINRSGLLQVT